MRACRKVDFSELRRNWGRQWWGYISIIEREFNPLFSYFSNYHQPQWRSRIEHSTFVFAFSEICKLTKLTIVFDLINMFIILKIESRSVSMSMNISCLQKCKGIYPLSSTTRGKPLQSKSEHGHFLYGCWLINTHTHTQRYSLIHSEKRSLLYWPAKADLRLKTLTEL